METTANNRGPRCRWFRVIGRARGTCYVLGNYLTVTGAAAIRRARRERAHLVGGLELKAEALR